MNAIDVSQDDITLAYAPLRAYNMLVKTIYV
jgi:hypothetical protein